ncbi:MerR family transcriptional regulator [Bacillus lacus]|uniref:MerR family transcriptional regulator n=1 Tax=Metabacillus lacus TaxID=1983721 RepID=A0A7X2J2W4_9BACI|nr:MerR family transcriptional regulator [Metabacillus lacus]MRX74410.1 MerR family transcriptional regulator [Metabacillus lacus]
MFYQVKEVAEYAGISVRTLHHYDEIGLLKPSSVTEAGYRQYTEENLERLQQILFLKEVGFSLKDITEIIDAPGFNRRTALKSHKRVLMEKKKRLEQMINTIEDTIAAMEGGEKVQGENLFKGLSLKEVKDIQEKYQEEVKEKYNSAVIEDSLRRTSSYSHEQWTGILEKSEAIWRALADRMDQKPSAPEVQQLIGKWRELITTYYYDCTLEIFRGLGEIYAADERFIKNIDRYGNGLAKFMSEAIHVYCDQLENA